MEFGDRPTGQSINFVTCHDGFTANDLVSYDSKHNEANGEGGRDGTDANHSWNCGAEGPSGDHAISLLRVQQIKNLLALTLLSAGTPMILMGDEGRRSQGGNNNSYCQNNASSWLDWDLSSRNVALSRFVSHMIRLRFASEVSSNGGRLTLEQYQTEAQYEWHGIELGKPDWKVDSHSIAFTIHTASHKRLLYVAVNAFWEKLSFQLPTGGEAGPLGWRRIVDTSLDSPDDIAESGSGVPVTGSRYIVNSRSLIVLETSLS